MVQVSTALTQIHEERDTVLRQPPGAGRSYRLAHLAEREAACWAVVCELSRSRLNWLAALGAREHALRTAREWRATADEQRGAVALPVREGAVA